MKEPKKENVLSKPFCLIYILPAISGIILRLAFPKPSIFPLAFIAIVPLGFSILRIDKKRYGFIAGFVFGFIFHYSNIFWLNTVAAYNPFAYAGIFFLGIYLSIFGGLFGLFGVMGRDIFKKYPPLFLAALWLILEYLRAVGQLAFPWSYLSATQAENIPLIQISEITGVWGISFLIALFNFSLSALADAYFKKISLKRYIVGTVVVTAIVGVVFIFGLIRMKGDYDKDNPVRVVILQPNISQDVKFASYAGTEMERQQLPGVLEDINFELLYKLKEGSADLVVFPESAFTRPYFGLLQSLLQKIKQQAKRINAPILIGANREVFFDKNGNRVPMGDQAETVGAYNSAWYFLPTGKLHHETYDKIHLVPFGEHLPYFDLIPGFQKIIVQTGSFLKGDRYTLFPLENESGEEFRFGTVICFESTVAWLFRKFSSAGADFMVVITNDGWYEDSAGPYQHADLSIFRAVETRQWIVRCSNRGISCFIDPTGKIVSKTELNKATIMNGKIFAADYDTFYEKFGNWLVYLVIIAVAAALIIHKLRSNKDRRKNSPDSKKT